MNELLNDFDSLKEIVKDFQEGFAPLITKLGEVKEFKELYLNFVNVFMTNLMGIKSSIEGEKNPNLAGDIVDSFTENHNFFKDFINSLNDLGSNLSTEFIRVYDKHELQILEIIRD